MRFVSRSLGAGAALVIGFNLAVSGPVQAQQVVLELKDGGFTVAGTLTKYDGRMYSIQSKIFGLMTLDARQFTCKGEACPSAAAGPAPSSVALTPRNSRPVSVHGSNTIGTKLMPALIRSYAKSIGATVTKAVGKSPREIEFRLASRDGKRLTTIDLRRHGSSTAFPALLQRQAVIGMSDRPINAKEMSALADVGYPNMRSARNENVIGLDGMIVVVGQDNPVSALSMDELADVFSGKVRNWSELGLPAGEITVIAPDKKSGTFSTFRSLVLKPKGFKISPDAQRFASNSAVSDLVAKTPNAIGLTGFAYKRSARPIAIRSSCGLTSQPSVFNVKTEEYPLSRRLFLYTTDPLRNVHAKALMAHILSPAAQPALRQVEFIDQSIELLNFGDQGGRIAHALNATPENFNMPLMRDVISEMTSGQRLSTTFRFKAGSSGLDSRAQQDIPRLVNFLTQPKYSGKQILFFGFADSSGPFSINTALSKKRATTVRDLVLQASNGRLDPDLMAVRAYSELAPVACNDANAGREKNRRVEIWVRDRGSRKVVSRPRIPRPHETAENPPQ